MRGPSALKRIAVPSCRVETVNRHDGTVIPLPLGPGYKGIPELARARAARSMNCRMPNSRYSERTAVPSRRIGNMNGHDGTVIYPGWLPWSGGIRLERERHVGDERFGRRILSIHRIAGPS